MPVLAAGFLLVVLQPVPAYAYLDPGTGSMLLSAIIGIAATVFFAAKTFYYKAAGLFYRLTGTPAPDSGKQSIVFYSEGARYWNTFKPVLQALDSMGEKAVYLTSEQDDPGLSHPFTHITARCIGAGNRAYAAMNMLEAAVCVMTTPGLDVLQIRRSPGVGHYAHLVHSPTDAALYKLYSFDYFDSVLCSGKHQIRSLRFLETLRGTPKKQLLATGCLYMDALAEARDTLQNTPSGIEALTATRDALHKTSSGKGDIRAGAARPIRVLLAPTWGENGLLRRFGLTLLRPLLEAGFCLTVRPHPQSAISEPQVLRDLKDTLKECANLTWDHEVNQLPAMLASDVLLSDFSGIVFDYAFVLERPVITIAAPMDTRGMEAGDLPYPAWELTVLPDLGASVEPENIRHLPDIIAALPPPETFIPRIRALRDESLFNYRSGGRVAARQILGLRTA